MRPISGFSSCAARSRMHDALAPLLGASPGSEPPGSPNLSPRFPPAPRALAQDARRDGDADQDQHGAADLLAPLFDPPPEPVAQLETGERHGDADCADGRGGHQDVDLQATQGETDRQVVDAQSEGGDDQAMRLQAPGG